MSDGVARGELNVRERGIGGIGRIGRESVCMCVCERDRERGEKKKWKTRESRRESRPRTDPPLVRSGLASGRV